MKSTKDIMDHQKKVMPQNKVEKLEANNFLIFILIAIFFVFTTKFTLNDYGLYIDSNKLLNFLQFNNVPKNNLFSLFLYKGFFAFSPFKFFK